jgi:hypothetical protein
MVLHKYVEHFSIKLDLLRRASEPFISFRVSFSLVTLLHVIDYPQDVLDRMTPFHQEACALICPQVLKEICFG